MDTPLIPQELISLIPDFYETEESSDPTLYVRLTLPHTRWQWYITELSRKDYDICFGYVIGLESELGYFSLRELQSLEHSLGMRVERDEGFVPTRLSTIALVD